jgi:hypothetical protein
MWLKSSLHIPQQGGRSRRTEQADIRLGGGDDDGGGDLKQAQSTGRC